MNVSYVDDAVFVHRTTLDDGHDRFWHKLTVEHLFDLCLLSDAKRPLAHILMCRLDCLNVQFVLSNFAA